MADTKYLKQRRQSWYFYLKIPADLKGKLRGSHIEIPLKTRDLSKAQKDRWPILAEWMARFEVQRGQREWTPAEIEVKANAEFDQALNDFVTLNYDDATLEAEQDLLIERLEHGALSDLEYAKANARLRAAQGREVALRGQPFKRPETFGRRSIDLLTLKPVTSKGKKASGPQFKATAERYIEEVQRHPDTKLTEQTKGQYEAVFRLFQQWAGDPSLGEIDRAKSSEFLDVIASLNPLWGRSPKTKKRTFAEIFKDYGNHSPGLSNRTINRYSVALSLIWAWAEGRGLVPRQHQWHRFEVVI